MTDLNVETVKRKISKGKYLEVIALLKKYDTTLPQCLIVDIIFSIKSNDVTSELRDIFLNFVLIHKYNLNDVLQNNTLKFGEKVEQHFGQKEIRCNSIGLAVLIGNPGLVRLLHQLGADANSNVEMFDSTEIHLKVNNNLTSMKLIDVAAELNHAEVVSVLNLCSEIEQFRVNPSNSLAADKLFDSEKKSSWTRLYSECFCDITRSSDGEDTALKLCEYVIEKIGDAKATQDLLNLWNFIVPLQEGDSPFIGTCIHICVQKNYAKLVEFFYTKGADINKIMMRDASDGTTPLHQAAEAKVDKTKVITSLIRCNFKEITIKINARDRKGNTPLHLACAQKRLVVIKLLCDAGASKEAINSRGECPSLANRLKIDEAYVNVLHDCGVKFSARNRKTGETLLHRVFSSLSHDCKVVKLLLVRGVPVNKVNSELKTPLHLLCSKKSICFYCLKLLLEYNADVNIADDTGRNSLMVLISNKSICEEDRLKAIRKLCKAGTQVNLREKEGLTALMMAAKKGNLAVAKQLCEFKARPNIRSKEGKTALHYAASANQNHEKMIECLKSFGADDKLHSGENKSIAKCDIATNSIFQHNDENEAVSNTYRNDFITFALQPPKEYNKFSEKFSFLFKTNKSYSTFFTDTMMMILEAKQFELYLPLHSLVIASRFLMPIYIKNLMKILRKMQYRHLLNVRDVDGNTALHWAIMLGTADLIKELRFCDPEILNNAMLSPLHLAVLIERGATMTTIGALLDTFYLKQACYDIDHPNLYGDSALIMCLKRGDKEKVKLLLKYGANLSLRGHNGIPALHCLVEAEIIHKSAAIAEICELVLLHDQESGGKNDDNVNDDGNYLPDVVNIKVKKTTYDGMNVLQFAAFNGATQLLKACISLVSRTRYGDYSTTDVTYLLPQAVPNMAVDINVVYQKSLEEQKYRTSQSQTSVTHSHAIIIDKTGNSDENDTLLQVQHKIVQPICPKSCLELLVSSNRPDDVSNLLECHPFKQLVHPYKKMIQVIYLSLITLHVSYMITFCLNAMPSEAFLVDRFPSNNSNLINDSNRSMTDSNRSMTDSNRSMVEITDVKEIKIRNWFSLFILWPLAITITSVISLLQQRFAKIGFVCSGSNIYSLIVCLLFLTVSIVWLIIYKTVEHKNYYLCITAIYITIGIAVTMKFFKVFKRLNILISVMMKIIVTDSLYFFALYAIFLLSFSLSFIILSNVETSISDYTQGVHITFMTFFQTLGMGSLLDDLVENEQHVEMVKLFVKLMLVLYISLTTVVLLNMLIAMMNESYTQTFTAAKRSDDRHTLLLISYLLRLQRLLPRCFLSFYRLFSSNIEYDEKYKLWNIPNAVTECQLAI